LLVQFGFHHLRLRRIEATCDPDNQASARVLQKAGLSYEGLMRSHMLVGGVGRDSLLYAVIEGGSGGHPVSLTRQADDEGASGDARSP
jgi:RimJ/RimL family protein N-acetyltransferase